MKKRFSLILPVLFAWLLTFVSCKKDFLDERPDKALLVPQTAADMQFLLDNNQVFNLSPGLFNNADGDTWTTETGYNGYLLEQERASYTWSPDIFGNAQAGDWNIPYQQIFYANVVLEGLDKLGTATGPDKDALRGTALFYRSYAYFNLLQEFARPYNPLTAATDPGVPLRLSSDVTFKADRSTVGNCYAQLIRDLLAARRLLPAATSFKTRPGVAAAFALLSRVYLNMADYEVAGRYADSCLQQNAALIDYNTVNAAATRPFPRALPNSNEEIIFYSVALSYTFTSSASPTLADPALYSSYAVNDLRSTVFFRSLPPGFKFKGNYAGILSAFSGIATDELYLTRAECSARGGRTTVALADLNTLLSKRWKAGTFVPLTAGSSEEALALVLRERRKELTGRGTRWTDLRRLNPDPRFAIALSRTILGKTYTLEPNSKWYTYPIPAEEVRLNNLVQNER
ncbi:RagB/SusD family nutrient uptake outer membrane protein [Mucilaginibacter terrenus]|uniref:RagB/SusD family nutrient uptake outer membrane protein n=1 Tax=Mucilaginibacter terrenus TaxID=2482727 RepID=A0A3E2NVS8_9SPHI|nr:RagB/SusD family nutrient uptake outer membrane protein [Mucilaginibacter terrenus]RFZ85115.1 RagB/SusD family nutrient uptake outer membrane protein [Mucilaginibacter terrenus]